MSVSMFSPPRARALASILRSPCSKAFLRDEERRREKMRQRRAEYELSLRKRSCMAVASRGRPPGRPQGGSSNGSC